MDDGKKSFLSLLSLASCASEDRSSVHLITSECSYYHYLCDGCDDRGWGCGYRTLQSLCSWVTGLKKPAVVAVPSILEIQTTLVQVGDKPPSFVSSKEWIGSYEASIVLNQLYGVSCKILHIANGCEVVEQVDALSTHFRQVGSPVMIGGNLDGASKTLLGVSTEKADDPGFLIADPHYCGGSESISSLLSDSPIRWHSKELYLASSFYNFCLPQLP